MIRSCDIALKALWGARFSNLPQPAREALRSALLELRCDALKRANVQWKRHKAPMAYWKVVGVYAGHLARALRAPCKREASAGPIIARGSMHAADDANVHAALECGGTGQSCGVMTPHDRPDVGTAHALQCLSRVAQLQLPMPAAGPVDCAAQTECTFHPCP